MTTKPIVRQQLDPAERMIVPFENVSRYARILISGPSGAGKTSIIGTACKKALYKGVLTTDISNLLVIELDPDGDITFKDMGVRPDVVKPTTETELIEILQYLNSDKSSRYDTVAIDPYNELQWILSRTSLAAGIAEAAKGKSPRQHDTEIPELREYLRLYVKARNINNMLLSIKKHLIVTCIMEIKDDPKDMDKAQDKRHKIISLALEGKMAHMLSAAFSIHGILEKEGNGDNIHNTLDFNRFNSEAKTRFKMNHFVESNKMENPTFPKLLFSMGIKAPSFNKIQWAKNIQGLFIEGIKD